MASSSPASPAVAKSFGTAADKKLESAVRKSVNAGRYEDAQELLAGAARRRPALPAAALVSVAPDVLGPDLPIDGDGFSDDGDRGTFTVITPEPKRAAATLARVGQRLLSVDQFGEIKSSEQRWQDEMARQAAGGVAGDEVYTPNYVSDPYLSKPGVVLTVDTKGCMWAPMGRTMVRILGQALVKDGVPAHITGHLPELDDDLTAWKGH